MTLKSDTLILKVALAFAAMILSVNAFAQNSFTVSLRLADENTEAPVGFATASITNNVASIAKALFNYENGDKVDSNGVAESTNTQNDTTNN